MESNLLRALVALGSMMSMLINLFATAEHSLAKQGVQGEAVVHFETSCSSHVASRFDVALNWLYLFEYEDSLKEFEAIALQEPGCCMAFFMAASTYTHPIWTFIDDQSLAEVERLSARATSCAEAAGGNITARERAYVNALRVYANTSDPGVAAPADRLRRWSEEMEAIFDSYMPEDENAGILYGLSLLAVGYYTETEPADGWPHLLEAARVEQLVVARNPRSPGAFHYLVHALDQPGLAPRAWPDAVALVLVADMVPHAQHMPSHIDSDLGVWNRSVSANALSLRTAFNQGNYTGDWFHGAYFLQYAMLQLAMDCDAEALVAAFRRLEGELQGEFRKYSESALRVVGHLLVETRSWEAAASFSLDDFFNVSGGLSQGVWPAYARVYESFITAAGRAVLPAAYNNSAVAAAVAVVEAANATLHADPDWRRLQMPYFRLGFDLLVQSARAWRDFRTVSPAAGVASMERVSALELRSWAPEIGFLWSPNEQLAEMLLMRAEMAAGADSEDDVVRALAVYQVSVQRYPNRYRSIAGAAACAARLARTAAEMRETACTMYGRLLLLTATPLPAVAIQGVPSCSCPRPYARDRRPELKIAREYVRAYNCSDHNQKAAIVNLLY